ncbi:MAG: agmatine deiminase family protein [Bryobacterales bacterium]|nr:agmatine deiminase family protein [Bryobacterales bacterium]
MTKPAPNTPRASGFRMPAEWEPHEATWIAWPHNRLDWPGKFAAIPWVYGEIVRKLSQVERVRILVNDESAERAARRILKRVGAALDAVEFFRLPTDRVWTRDFGPIFVIKAGETAITNWVFNGWAKYPDWRKDNEVPGALATLLKMRQWEPGLVLEGGSIDVNGRGALLTTEECLLSPVQARNPGMSRAEIERSLANHLGATKVIWLKNGIAGDDTHGHVDDLARFVDAETVVTVIERERGDANYEPLRENLQLLRRERFRVVTLPMPTPVFFDGVRLPASYANFYIANGLVLVPTFNDPNDRVALRTLARLFPDREVAGIHAVDLVWGLGTLHCMTQQQPSAHHRTPPPSYATARN